MTSETVLDKVFLLVEYSAFLLVIGGVTFILTKALRFQQHKITFPQPRLEALIAVPVAWFPAFLLFGIAFFLKGSEAMRGGEVHEYNLIMVQNQAINFLITLLPMFILLRLRRQGCASIGWSRHNLGRSALVGLLLGSGLIAIPLVTNAADLISSLDREHFYAFLYYAVVGFGEETLYRGYLQTRMIAWLGDWAGWAATSILMALVHLPHRLFILGLAPVAAVLDTLSLIPVSLLHGYVMLRTENVVAPGILHLFANWLNTLG